MTDAKSNRFYRELAKVSAPVDGKWWYPTAFSSWGTEEQIAIQRVLNSGKLTMGPEVAAFEREFAYFHGRAHGIMVNSGSSANLVAVASLFHKAENRLKRGDLALVPALAWSTTYAPLVQHGLDLRLADCDETWNASMDVVSEKEPPRLVVGVPILGNPAHARNWALGAAAIGAYYLEDCCESLGAITEGRPSFNLCRLCGTFGDLSTFSFFHSHQVSAVEGGMILADDPELAALCRMLRAHGWTRDVLVPAEFEREYDFQVFGYNVRPLELHAAVAREQLRKLPGFIAGRTANLAQFRALTDGLPIEHPRLEGRTSPFSLNFLAPSKEARAGLARALRAAGIDCRLPTGGSFTRHAYGAPWRSQRTPRADDVHDRGMFLGNAPYAIPGKIERAVEVMRGAL